jgi:hypothetical protein
VTQLLHNNCLSFRRLKCGESHMTNLARNTVNKVCPLKQTIWQLRAAKRRQCSGETASRAGCAWRRLSHNYCPSLLFKTILWALNHEIRKLFKKLYKICFTAQSCILYISYKNSYWMAGELVCWPFVRLSQN